MANYTSSEVQAAVEKIVRSSVRTPTGVLGNRDVQTTFSDIQEAASGVFILYFNAPFYTLYLGTRRLLDAVDTQAQVVHSLLDAVRSTDRLTTPVKDVSPLANARSALEELEAAISSRSKGFQDIEDVPAYRRYAQSISGFITSVGPNVKGQVTDAEEGSGTQGQVVSGIVDTPSGARRQIPSLVLQLREQHEELIRRATLLARAMEDFAALELPRVAAQGVISRAWSVLDSHYTTLVAQTEEARLENLRGVVLDLLTQKPLVQKYGAALAPSEFIATSGQAEAYSDSTHSASPAALASTKYGPYAVLESALWLRFQMDGGPSIDYALPAAYVAELRGVLAEPFNIEGDRDALRIEFGNPNGVLEVHNVVLPIGLQTAATIVSTIAAVIVASDLGVERIFSPLRYDSIMSVVSLGGNDARFTVLGGSLTGLGIVPGDELDIHSGPDSGTTWTITSVDPGGQFVDGSGLAPVTPDPDIEVQIGPAARALRLFDTYPPNSLAQRRIIRLPVTYGDEDRGAVTLGWTPGMETRSRPVAASDIANNIAQSSPTVNADTVFVATRYTGQARSHLTDASRVVLSKYIAEGTLSPGGAATFTATSVTNVAVGDRIVIRETAIANEVNREGAVVGVTATTIAAMFGPPITGGAVQIEVGPDASFGFGDVLNVTSGNNQGRYTVREPRSTGGVDCSFELLLERALPYPKEAATTVSFDVEFGQELVRFKSRSTATTSQVTVSSSPLGSAAGLFFSVLPATAIGTTPWLRFDVFPTGASISDLVLLYEAVYNIVSRTFTITGLEPSSRIVRVSPEIETTASFSFDFDVPAPFGRIRVAKVADYSTLKSRLESWLARAEQQSTYFTELVRLLNPILVNSNPTLAQVNAVLAHLKKLWALLNVFGATYYGTAHSPPVGESSTLEYALANYSAPVEEAVDTLLATFRNKGSDRAIDLLLEGRFGDFFGLDQDGVSYSGQLMKSLREMAREDLPIRKTDRRSLAGQTQIGTISDEKDFEYTSDDADSPDTPDIPVGESIG